MIKKCDSLIQAENVLNLLMSNSKTKDVECYVECYQNGREQGFLLFGFPKTKAIYFSENRNSDKIVVYVGDYSMQSISDDAYRNKYYAIDAINAVEYIVNQMQVLNNIKL